MPISQVISRLLKIDVVFKDIARKTYFTGTKSLPNLSLMCHKIRAINCQFWILCYYKRQESYR